MTDFCTFSTKPLVKKSELPVVPDADTIMQKILALGDISTKSTFYQNMYNENQIAAFTKKVVTALLLSDSSQKLPTIANIGASQTLSYVVQRSNNKNLTVAQVINEFPALEGPTIGVKAFALAPLRRKKLSVNKPNTSLSFDFNPASIQTEITNDDAQTRGQYESQINNLIQSNDDNIDAFINVRNASYLSAKEKDVRINMIGEIVVGKYNSMPEFVHQKIDVQTLNSMTKSAYQAYINHLIRAIRLATSSANVLLESRAGEVKYPLESITYQRN